MLEFLVRIPIKALNEKHQEDFKVLHDMMTKLLKATEDHQRDHDENVKLNTELLKAKADQSKKYCH